jgi:hypothetical protein
VTLTRALGAVSIGILITSTAGSTAYAADLDVDAAAPPTAGEQKLSLLAGAGYLGTPAADGGAFLAGLRLALGDHFAASVDLGYGLVSAAPTVQDRWWVMPAAAWVIPAGSVRVDLGAGAGVGTSSGYLTWSDSVARPFTPVWHFTVPAVRAHVAAAGPLTRNVDLFARADVASLLFAHSQAGAADTTWFTLWVGVQSRLL